MIEALQTNALPGNRQTAAGLRPTGSAQHLSSEPRREVELSDPSVQFRVAELSVAETDDAGMPRHVAQIAAALEAFGSFELSSTLLVWESEADTEQERSRPSLVREAPGGTRIVDQNGALTPDA